ncbi:hypothetical protein SMICM304S_01290 [Streptomyces microflavus]
MTPGKKRLLSLLAVLATLLSGLGLALIGQNSAQAHGVTMTPGSRTYLCYLDARTVTGALDPTNAACKAALAESGSNALYNWFAVLDSNAGGRGPGYVPDDKLCSAGDRSPYNFTGYNAARADWPRTHLTSGSTIRSSTATGRLTPATSGCTCPSPATRPRSRWAGMTSSSSRPSPTPRSPARWAANPATTTGIWRCHRAAPVTP